MVQGDGFLESTRRSRRESSEAERRVESVGAGVLDEWMKKKKKKKRLRFC